MATEIKLPELGENLDSGDVLDVKVAAGATVTKGQTLLEIEAEKSTVEVPSPLDGRVSEVRVKKGDRVTVGQTLCLIDSPDDARDGNGKPAAEEKSTPKKEAPAPPKDPEKKQAVAEPEKKPAPPDEGASKPTPTASEKASDAPASAGNLVPAGPATRRLARELGVDLQQVRGTAPGGRITEADVKTHVREVGSGGAGVGVKALALPDFEKWGAVERRPLDGVRRRTAEQMALAWSLVPHVTQHDLADITDLDNFRRQHAGPGPKLTVTAFALKAAAVALKQFPQFNASLDTASNQLLLKRYYHIGVAVDTERGLLVPVLRDVDRKSVGALAQELTDVADRARQKKLTADEMRGGTFTITNLGGIGGTAFSPIVNWPEVAILGMVRARLQPVIRDNQVVPRLLLPLCVSYDHRVIDGADAARFTRRIADLLENPLQMLL